MKSLVSVLLGAVVTFGSAAEKVKPVEDAATAIAIAESALTEKFGAERVAPLRPFKAELVKQEDKAVVWIVYGERKAPKDMIIFGGSMTAVIRKEDGQVLNLIAWK